MEKIQREYPVSFLLISKSDSGDSFVVRFADPNMNWGGGYGRVEADGCYVSPLPYLYGRNFDIVESSEKTSSQTGNYDVIEVQGREYWFLFTEVVAILKDGRHQPITPYLPNKILAEIKKRKKMLADVQAWKNQKK